MDILHFRKILLYLLLLVTTNVAAKEKWIYTYDDHIICGNSFKKYCGHVFDEYGFYCHPEGHPDYYFVKTDLLETFFGEFLPDENFILITHNSDRGITEKELPYIECENLVKWYAVNVNIEHEKLLAIPIGVCNFANFNTLKDVIHIPLNKSQKTYANYTIANNITQRKKCLKHTKIPLAQAKPFKEFLKDIKKSYFVISPEGNGIDCHRTWESLYLKAIPIVTSTVHTESFKEFPILILDGWEDYNNAKISIEEYTSRWHDFNFSKFTVVDFLK